MNGGQTYMNYKTYRNNPVNCQNGRPTSGHCIECGNLTSLVLGGKRVTIPSQTNGVWVCHEHRGTRNLHSYYDENSTRVGSGNAENISISVELETMGNSTAARAYLVNNDFLPTHDSTVDIEYKSPIYTSRLPLAKVIGGIEYLDKNPNYRFSVNNGFCGIHTHFGFIDNHYNFNRLSEHYYKLFRELSNIVNNLTPNERIAIFGRDFDRYNSQIDFSDPYSHCNWINIQHQYTLEIRMPRFKDATQYMTFVNCFREIFKVLDKYYISKEKNSENAIKTGHKMAKKFLNMYKDVIDMERISSYVE